MKLNRNPAIPFVLFYLLAYTVTDPDNIRICKGRLVPNFRNKISDNGFLRTLNVKSLMRCSDLCTSTLGCASFFFLKKERRCRMHWTVLDKAIATTSAQNDTVYYQMCDGRNCPYHIGYTYVEQFHLCYKINDTGGMDRQTGINACNSDGGHLMWIENRPVNDYLVNLILADHSQVATYYIDGSDAEVENTWTNYASKPMMWFSWAGGEPNDWGSGEDCMCLRGVKNPKYSWDDHNCITERGGFICQIDI